MMPPEEPPEPPEEHLPEPPPDEPVSDQELPPPPPEGTEITEHYPPLRIRKPGPAAAIRRAFTIFEKDLRTMAKHGLVSAVILFVFLGVVFTITSYAMSEVMKIDLGGGPEGDGEGPGPLPGSTDRVPPVAEAGSDLVVPSGTTVTLDASASTDNEGLFYYMWEFEENGQKVQLFGETVEHTFYAVGHYEVELRVWDTSWNMASDDISVEVLPLEGDMEPPMANAGSNQNVMVGGTVTFDGSASTDNVGVVNWTWMFEDFDNSVNVNLYGPNPSYRFDNVGSYWVRLIVRDGAGWTSESGVQVEVQTVGGDTEKPWPAMDIPQIVNVGDTVKLDASRSSDNQGIGEYIWFVRQNSSMRVLHGEKAQFVAEEVGVYEVVLAVRDMAGNVAATDNVVLVYPQGVDADAIAWSSTPFGTDISFNVLTYAYGVALLISVIYVGGLFAKGFNHEISKGTIKTLFFGPISVTTMVFSKLLYPFLIGPVFIFPLVFVSLSPLKQPSGEILLIALIAYALCVVTVASAAYGSCALYAAAKRMVLKPSTISRMFLYISLVLTLTVFEWTAFAMDNLLGTDTWGDLYATYHGVTAISPFHQGGVLLSNLLLGTGQSPDYVLFAIPLALILLGVLASRRLYSDIFSRE